MTKRSKPEAARYRWQRTPVYVAVLYLFLLLGLAVIVTGGVLGERLVVGAGAVLLGVGVAMWMVSRSDPDAEALDE